MPFSLSPSVSVIEKDLTAVPKAVATSIGALTGEFEWGPVKERRLIDGEESLIKTFGYPTNSNYKDWFTAADFFAYSNACQMVRVVGTGALNGDDLGTGQLVENQDDFDADITTIDATGASFISKYPGIYGNDIVVDVADAANFVGWEYEDNFDYAPTGNEFWVAVLYKGNIVEKFYVNRDTDAKDYQGQNNYAAEVVNRTSQYVWLVATNLITYVGETPDPITGTYNMAGGADGTAAADGDRQLGWDLFSNEDDVDINLAMMGGASKVTGKYILDNVSSTRKDCIALLSPEEVDVVNAAAPETSIVSTRNTYGSSSYAVMDGNYKYRYDKYNDLYRWIPMNGDIAGLCANVDSVGETWFSPGGPDKGRIKNVIKLAWNPSKAKRDELYKNGVNPVINKKGDGTLLYGDKTLLSAPSTFDRINVRRLFIVLEKSISNFAEYSLFEQNDEFTRRRFVDAISPFLRSVQARRGIEEFQVMATADNQTADPNEFVADIYIKPVYAINFITLNFVAVGPSVSFEEVIGA